MKMKINFHDEAIKDLFHTYWSGELKKGKIEDQRECLFNEINKQINGFWSGSSAYNIMKWGGFIIDDKEGVKKLTKLGEYFYKCMSNRE